MECVTKPIKEGKFNMKYFIIIIAVVIIISAGVVGYFFIKHLPISQMHLVQDEKKSEQASTDELKTFNSRLDKLQSELVEIKLIIAKQSLFIQKIKEDTISDSSKVISLEKKFQDAIENVRTFLSENKESPNPSHQPLQTQIEQTEQIDQPEDLSDSLESSLSSTYSSELFKDPNFTKEFKAKVAEVVKNIQQKQLESQMKLLNKQVQQMINKKTDYFAKKEYLNDYQKQELNNILSDRSNKVLDLFSKLRNQKILPEQFVSKRNAYRNESNEKIKQILLPQQYGQYQKIEPSLNQEMMDLLRQNNVPP
jgi:hypothetical protein